MTTLLYLEGVDSLSSWAGIKDWAGSRISSKVILVLKGILLSQTEKNIFDIKSRPKILKNIEEIL